LFPFHQWWLWSSEKAKAKAKAKAKEKPPTVNRQPSTKKASRQILKAANELTATDGEKVKLYVMV